MRIGIDATCWWSRRGFGRFTRGILNAMFDSAADHEFVLFMDRPPEEEMIKPGVSHVLVDVSKTVTESAVAGGSRSLRDIYRFKKAVSDQSLDIMFFPAVYSWFPVQRGLPVVVTLHDAIAERFPDLVFPDRKGRLLWGLKMRLACWQASRFITVSDAAKQEITEYLRLKPQDIDVVSEAADLIFKVQDNPEDSIHVRQQLDLPQQGRLVVYVGGLAPHKNIAGFLQAFGQAVCRSGAEDLHMVLIGDVDGDGFHSHYQELLSLVNAKPELAGRVHFTGYLSDADLVHLLAGSLALCLPSFSEGFGLPAIEAMACGVPVLASKAGSLPEVVGDAGILFDPHSIADMTQAIETMATNVEALASLKRAALQRSALFTWEAGASKVLLSLESVLAGRR